MPGKMTFGIIVGNRGFFPGHLAKTGRTELIAALDRAGYDHVVLDRRAEPAWCRGNPRRGQALRRAVPGAPATASTA